MKVVILAGGVGSRISEESTVKPKPLIEVGHQPILWHIMKIYAAHGLFDFIICCGYKGHLIKEYFAHYFLRNADVTFDLRANEVQYHRSTAEPWRVTLVDTGDATMTGGRLTGGRLKRVQEHIGNETFCLTYGDGVADSNISESIRFHQQQGTLATMTAVRPPGRFGAFTLSAEADRVLHFREKPPGDGAWVNGGYFVLQPEVIDFVRDDQTVWEQEPMEKLAHKGQLSAYKHTGFWQPMDTLRDKMYLEELWAKGQAPWKIW
jgi:glucose-1-phosphate cytidylyltransferase